MTRRSLFAVLFGSVVALFGLKVKPKSAHRIVRKFNIWTDQLPRKLDVVCRQAALRPKFRIGS